MRLVSIALWLTAHVLALAAPALASDGVLEINQTCAVNTGCFAGDTPGFPVTITGTGGGSYRLTSDLALSDANTDGIQISTNNVTLDLGGFMIRCRTFSFPTFSLCGAGGFALGSGVRVNADDAARGAEIRNGSIVGMGNRSSPLSAAPSADEQHEQHEQHEQERVQQGPHLAMRFSTCRHSIIFLLLFAQPFACQDKSASQQQRCHRATLALSGVPTSDEIPNRNVCSTHGNYRRNSST